ncbi:ANTAR domain-containing protein [Nocardioides sp. MAHUQ-72]|uniref:ANTAR domain-containing protein n=1 Tax=unclassified Nocardioides TaxID=2615069 RepID=UPI0036188DD2
MGTQDGVAAIVGAVIDEEREQPLTLSQALEQIGHLERALETRSVICRAEGIVMERFGIDEASAWRMLVRISTDSNVKLHDVAAGIVATRTIPGRGGPGGGPTSR